MFEHRSIPQRLTEHDREIAELKEKVARLEALLEPKQAAKTT
jgi:uncharacterized small protein (DUF1192 family)